MSTLARVACIAVACALAVAATGCVVRPPKATTTPDDPAGRAQCFANQEAVETAVIKKIMETDARMPSNYGQVKSMGFIDEFLWCPAGGNMVWVPIEGGYLECDIHGRWSDQPAQPVE